VKVIEELAVVAAFLVGATIQIVLALAPLVIVGWVILKLAGKI
jgi:hypothetical protein